MAHPPTGPRPRIRLRFTMLYAATLLVVLVGAATVVRFALRATLAREFEESVRASASLVTQFFRTEVNEYRTIEATLTHISGELVFEDRLIHYRLPDGRLFRSKEPSATPRVATLRSPMHSVRFPLDAELRAVTHQVDELLQLARADATGDAVMTNLQPLYLDDLIADEMPRWQPQAQQLGATISLGALEETPVRGDAVLLARLSGVLMDNALRNGGSPGEVRVPVRPDGAQALLMVEDNGPGVPLEERERVFDRFYRGEAARHRRTDGSGLGLAIAAWIVRRHGGAISLEASELGGAKFMVRLG